MPCMPSTPEIFVMQWGAQNVFRVATPPWRQPRGKWMGSYVNSHTNAIWKRWPLWEIDRRFALNSSAGWFRRGLSSVPRQSRRCSPFSTRTVTTLDSTPYALHPTPYTLHHTPYAIHDTPYTLISDSVLIKWCL